MAFGRRKRVGLIISDTTGSTSYENDIWTGAHDAACKRGVDLIVIAGSDFSDKARTGISDPRNRIYDLYSPDGFDGIVLSTTTTCMGLDAAEASRFIQRFESRPFVMINGFQGKYRSLVDNKGGAYATIDHLIKVHGKKRIGYIRGPEGTEADERFSAYKQALADNGLPYDDRLVYIGKFLRSSGTACAKEFLDARRVEFDAIGAANDAMAFGMIDALAERGLRVPEDVAVVGFDDLDGAAFSNPPLTTVRQPVYGQGYHAVEMVCDLIDGATVERDQARGTDIVFRQSCGCRLYGSAKGGALGAIGAEGRSWKEDRAGDVEKMIEAAGLREGDRESARRLASMIASTIERGSDADAVASLCAFFGSAAVSATDDPAAMRAWERFLGEVEKRYPAMAGPASGGGAAEGISIRLELIAKDLMMRADSSSKMVAVQNARKLRQLSQSIGMTYELAEIIKILNSELAKVGVPGYSLALMEGGGTPTLRHVQAFADGTIRAPSGAGETFSATGLYRREHFDDKRRTIVVYPLTFGSECIGTVAMEAGTRDGAAFDEIARQLSASMAGSRLMEESRAASLRIVERSRRTEELVLPMIASLERVARLAAEKSEEVGAIAAMAQQSYRRLDGTIGTIDRMSKSIGTMAQLIDAIDDISATINLVSLNASIEASHAGQYGRGFSVIAKEIKKLAESTQRKSSEISGSISEILGNMRNTTEAGKQCMDSYEEEEAGVKLLIDIFKAITRDTQSLASDGRKILSAMQS